jgi:hypothetical protein
MIGPEVSRRVDMLFRLRLTDILAIEGLTLLGSLQHSSPLASTTPESGEAISDTGSFAKDGPLTDNSKLITLVQQWAIFYLIPNPVVKNRFSLLARAAEAPSV